MTNRHYKIDQKGIMNRFLVEGENWENHLKNTKEYILSAIPLKAEKVAVLGSGWLLDVPINELLERKISVHLYDIHHPNQIKNKFKNNSNVKFIQKDLTNGLIDLAKNAEIFNEFSNEYVNLKPLNVFQGYDFVVSINLLNQLDILLCDLLKNRFRLNDGRLITIRKTIQQQHIMMLKGLKSCIVTDYYEVNYNDSKVTKNESELVFVDLNVLENTKEWIWYFDNHKTYKPKLNTMFKVIAGTF